MNKKIFIGGCMLASVANMLCADSGNAANDVTYFNPYVSVGAGLHCFGSRDNIKYKLGPNAAVEFGVSYDAWRVGLEVAYRQSKIKNVKNGINVKLGDNSEVPDQNKLLVILGEKDPEHDDRYLACLYKLDKISAFSGMLTLAYDYAVTEQWSVYAEVGAGMANVAYEVPQVTRFNDLNGKEMSTLNAAIKALADKEAYDKHVYKSKHNRSQNVFAWKAGLGGALELTENVKVMLGWNIFNTAKVKFVDGKKIKTPFGNEIKLRLLYSF
jgi:opacity protein-like surface antigen